VGKLADRIGELDYRLVTSDIEAARLVVAGMTGIQLIDNAARGRPDREVLVVRALVSDLDELMPRLVHAGIALRELMPVVSPLESAFLALTGQQSQETSR
jgi:ABC-2 type transport system ATP-binding protein